MNYEIYFKNDEKYPGKRVKFENGVDYCVNTDKEGREYFPIPNLYNNSENDPIMKQLFVGRIKDAITAIKNGKGDILSVSNMFGSAESVYRFVDRVYGEEMRQKTIEGWKNTEFGYSLKFGYLDSMSGSRFISKDYNILSIFDDPNNYIFFDTEEETEKVKQEILLEANEFVNGYEKVKDNDEECKNYLHKYYNENVFSQIGYAIISGNKWELEIVQAVKN
jgi:hypothetical protein